MNTKKNMSSQSMDAVLQDFLGNKPSMETLKLEPLPADTQVQASEAVQETANETMPKQTDETPQVVRRISGKQRRASLEEYKDSFLSVPSIDVRMFGERRMSVSGLVENIARQHLATYGEDIEAWRKL